MYKYTHHQLQIPSSNGRNSHSLQLMQPFDNHLAPLFPHLTQIILRQSHQHPNIIALAHQVCLKHHNLLQQLRVGGFVGFAGQLRCESGHLLVEFAHLLLGKL
jgi:hypothetical protein